MGGHHFGAAIGQKGHKVERRGFYRVDVDEFGSMSLGGEH
jgi:hypothetical protein